MPGLDRTGPEGKGSRSGRGLGKCKDPENSKENDLNLAEESRGWRRRFGFGGGFGKGQGRGQGRRRS